MMTKTTISAKKETVDRNWYVIDATDKVLGRLSTEITDMLRGKKKPCYTPHVDTGDHVVVINAEKVRVTGNKFEDKMYHRHTGYIGNLKSTNFANSANRVSFNLLAKEFTSLTSLFNMALIFPGLLISDPKSKAVKMT